MRINKENTRINQSGFTLIEVTIVVLIVSILLGFTVALIPKQQELRRYKEADREMDKILDAIVGFAQVNGRLPCPSPAASAGVSAGGGITDCVTFGGFVPSSTLGFQGRLNTDSLLSDPWGNPYRYYVSASDANAAGGADFVRTGEMREIGLVDIINVPLGDLSGDGYIDLDGQFMICDASDGTADDWCDPGNGSNEVFGNRDSAGGPYAGALFVLLSLGKNGNDIAASNTGAPVGDELENRGNSPTNGYRLKNVAGGETTFVKRPTGFADSFDDIVKWVSPSVLFSRMIEADQLP
jgi:prepilin-type N-terminal cleavage/methylation domain-containing protein